jgi:hypothetical protein
VGEGGSARTWGRMHVEGMHVEGMHVEGMHVEGEMA